MKVAIVGTGYVGLVSGVCLAARGHDVICVDTNPSVVERLNSGEATIFENGLPSLLEQVLNEKRFHATTQIGEALHQVELVIIAVGTPSKEGVIDLQYLRAAAREIGEYIRVHEKHISVVVKSTVIPGTTDTIVKRELEEASRKNSDQFGLGMNPEFLREGEAIEDFAFPDRIVLGYEDEKTLARLQELYKPWHVDKITVNTRTAEMIKYTNNALLATQISAVNEIANLAARLGGVDILDVMHGVHMDKRWNPVTASGRLTPAILTYLVPGCGFGGSCFPKDLQALRSQGEQCGLPMRMMNAILDVNEAQPQQVTEIIEQEFGSLDGREVLVLGLAFKPGTDDVRESASLKIVDNLLKARARIVAHDPVAMDHFKRIFNREDHRLKYTLDWKNEIPTADVIIVATRWPEYDVLADMNLKEKVLFDARRMFKPSKVGGAQYLTIGRRISP